MYAPKLSTRSKGQGLSEHTSPFDALVQAVEGEAEVTVSGKPIALKPGDVCPTAR